MNRFILETELFSWDIPRNIILRNILFQRFLRKTWMDYSLKFNNFEFRLIDQKLGLKSLSFSRVRFWIWQLITTGKLFCAIFSYLAMYLCVCRCVIHEWVSQKNSTSKTNIVKRWILLIIRQHISFGLFRKEKKEEKKSYRTRMF